MLNRSTSARRKGKITQEREKIRLMRALEASINERQACTNTVLTNSRICLNYRDRFVDKLDTDEKPDYRDDDTYNLQCTALRTTEVDDRISISAPVPLMSKPEFRQVRKATQS